MRYKFGIFTAIIWQAALPERPIEAKISGNAIFIYVTGRGGVEGILDNKPAWNRTSDDIFSQSLIVQEYGQIDESYIKRYYIDLIYLTMSSRLTFDDVYEFIRGTPSIRSLVVDVKDVGYFSEEEWMAFGDLDVEIHFVKKEWLSSDDESAVEKHLRRIKEIVESSQTCKLSDE